MNAWQQGRQSWEAQGCPFPGAAAAGRGGAWRLTAQRPDLSCSEGMLAPARVAAWELLLSSERSPPLRILIWPLISTIYEGTSERSGTYLILCACITSLSSVLDCETPRAGSVRVLSPSETWADFNNAWHHSLAVRHLQCTHEKEFDFLEMSRGYLWGSRRTAIWYVKSKTRRKLSSGPPKPADPACKAGDPGLIPGSGRPAGEGTGCPLQYSWASLVAQLVKNSPAMRETGVDPWVGKISWRREKLSTPVFWPGEFHELYSPWDRRVRHNWATFIFTLLL